MPTWRNTLPPRGQNAGYSLHRTPAPGSIAGIITCDDILVCDTHFWHGRTLPCERIVNEQGKTIDDTPCQACREKTAWRTHVYVSAFCPKKREHFIFECTAIAAKPLEEYRQATGTLRGCIIDACRPKCGKNSAVSIHTRPANLAAIALPNPPDLTAALAIIWRLPRNAIDTDQKPGRAPKLRTTADRLTAMREQPDNAADPPTIGEVLGNNGQKQTPVTTP